MKLLCLSDIHHHGFNIKQKADVLICCGDSNIDSEFKLFLFLEQFSRIDTKNKIYVAGNHDLILERMGKKETKRVFEQNDIIYLEDESIKIGGIKFYGSPWSKLFGNWSFMLLEKDLNTKFKKIPKDTDVLITHSPPYGIYDTNIFGEHCGSKSLLKHSSNDLKLHVWGHIHEAYGKIIQNNTTYINCSLLNEDYELVHSPVEYEI